MRLKCCSCFGLRCPFQDLNELGWLLCLELSPICARVLWRRSLRGKPGRAGWGGQRAWVVEPLCPPPRLETPTPKSEAAGRQCLCCPKMKRDEKFCMAGCGEKQRQSGWLVLRKKCIAILAVPPSQEKGAMQL